MTPFIRRLALAAGVAVARGGRWRALPAGNSLIVFDWSGYEDPLLHPDLRRQAYGTEPTFAFFGDEDEAFEKMRAGFKADIAHPCSQSVVKWREAGHAAAARHQPGSPAGTTSLPGIMGDEGSRRPTADGKAWFMPFDWGNTALLYRTDKVSAEEAQSLQDFCRSEIQGTASSIGDNVDDAYALASLVIGLKDWTKMTDAQFARGIGFPARGAQERARLLDRQYRHRRRPLSNGEVDLAWGWNETFVTLQGPGRADQP